MIDPVPPTLTAGQRTAADALAGDLRRTFGSRLHALVAYGLADAQPLHTLALVDRLTFEDLTACAPAAGRWRESGLAVPLLLGQEEFERSLDVFPLEYGEIVAHHVTIVGRHPLAHIQIDEADLRRACELQAKSHLIHLREGFLETHADTRQVVRLIAASTASLRALLGNIARLDDVPDSPSAHGDEGLAAFTEQIVAVPAALIREVLAFRVGTSGIADPTALLGRYIAASERICAYVDGWTKR